MVFILLGPSVLSKRRETNLGKEKKEEERPGLDRSVLLGIEILASLSFLPCCQMPTQHRSSN